LHECDVVADEVEARVLEDLDDTERRILLSSMLVALRRLREPTQAPTAQESPDYGSKPISDEIVSSAESSGMLGRHRRRGRVV